MELVLKLCVVLVQLALAGFVVWGGWLCFREWLLADPAAQAPAAAPRPQSFERVASLVLLALLCSTIAGLA